MTGRIAVVIVVVVVVLAAVWFLAVHRPAQQAQQPPVPPPTSGRPPHKLPTPAACPANGAPAGSYEQADCPSTCVAGGSAQNVTYSIDDYINPKPGDPTGGDPDICVRPARGDTITFAADTSAGRQVKVTGYKSNGGAANPFVGGLPIPVQASGQSVPRKLRTDLPPTPAGKCWVFHGSFEVTDSHGKQNCYDPHIYTDSAP